MRGQPGSAGRHPRVGAAHGSSRPRPGPQPAALDPARPRHRHPGPGPLPDHRIPGRPAFPRTSRSTSRRAPSGSSTRASSWTACWPPKGSVPFPTSVNPARYRAGPRTAIRAWRQPAGTSAERHPDRGNRPPVQGQLALTETGDAMKELASAPWRMLDVARHPSPPGKGGPR